MAVEFIGLLGAAPYGEIAPQPRGAFDRDFLARLAATYERGGYDRVLIGQNARSVDPTAIAAFVSGCTERLRFMIAHRPGFVAPTMAARLFATIDRLSEGRCGVHIITAANDQETHNDGDFLTKEERYHRSREYVQLLRRMWTSSEPFDHAGAFYRVEGAFADTKPAQAHIPLFWGGSSELGVRYGGELADVYALGGAAVGQVRATVDRLKVAAAQHGRSPGVSMSMRLIMADTPAKAWARAEDIREKVQARSGQLGRDLGEYGERRVAMAKAAGPDDPCLFTDLTVATGGRTQIMSLVGDPEQLAAALMAYHEAGVDHFLVTGFDSIPDAEAIGRDLIPLVRAAVARHDEEALRSA